MAVLRWLSRLVGSTLAWLFNAVLSLGLFLLSAHMFAMDDPDGVVFAYVMRGVAAIWLFGATWHYVKHGVLQRPRTRPARRAAGEKVSHREGLLATVGCLAGLGGALVTAGVVGPYADWVYAGLLSDDPAHPVQQMLRQAAEGAFRVAADPAPYLGGFVAVMLALFALRAVGATGTRPAPAGQGEGDTRRRRRRSRDRQRSGDAGRSQAPTGTPQTTSPPRRAPQAAPRVSGSGRTITAPMLGAFRRDDEAGGWRLMSPRDDVGGLLIKAQGEPREAQFVAAHAIVQRTFEVLLRAADAAAPAAKADGMALPRFTVADSVVHDEGGERPRVTIRLRAQDGGRVYEVSSTDGMQTFVA